MKRHKIIGLTGATLAAGLQAVGLIEFIIVTALALAVAGGAVYVGIKIAKRARQVGERYQQRILEETGDGAERALTNRFGTNIVGVPRRRLTLLLPTEGSNNVRLLWSPTANGTNWQPLVTACVDGLTQTLSTTQSSAYFRLEVHP